MSERIPRIPRAHARGPAPAMRSASTIPERPPRRRDVTRVPLRRVTPGATHFITKKTNDDFFWLRPDPVVNDVLEYLIFLKAEKYGIEVHAHQVMSNHLHLLITDPRGKYPAFMRELLSESGKALKLCIGTDRRIWSAERYNQIEILDADAAERFNVYCLVNPNRAHLTTAQDWPGLTSARFRFGETIAVERPDIYFSSRRPERVEFTLTTPPEVIHTSLAAERGKEAGECREVGRREGPGGPGPARRRRGAEEYQSRIQELVAREEAALDLERRTAGRRLAGPDKVRRTSRSRRGSRPFGGRTPRFASRDGALLRAAFESHREFEIAHAIAKQLYIEDQTRAVFPVGTYGYREQLRVRVAEGGRAA